MVDHLLEFHAIVCNPPTDYILGSQLLATSSNQESQNEQLQLETIEVDASQVQFMEDDVVEVEFVQQCSDGEEIMNDVDNNVEEIQVVRHSGVWNYFEVHTQEQKMYCLVCRQGQVVHSYSTNSSTSNLRKHLKVAHDIEVENYKPVSKKLKKEAGKRGSGMSPVWKYFCKITKNGVIQEKEYVYCGKCLENGTQHRYKQTSSTGTLKAHLKAIHSIDLNVKQEDFDVLEFNASDTQVIGATSVRKTKRMSSARPYFQSVPDDDEYVACTLCFNEDHVHKYRKTTSTTTMKAHLLQKHHIDPDNEENVTPNAVLECNLKEAIVECDDISERTPMILSFPPDIIEYAEKLTTIKTRKIRTYFFKLMGEDDVCCAFCVSYGIKKAYKSTTSTTGLRRHLIGTHQMDPQEFFQNNSDVDGTLNDDQLAESIAGTNKSKESDVWKYFGRKEIPQENGNQELDSEHIYCILCWNAPIREVHKYKTSTSSGALKRHLSSRHGMVIENTRHRSASSHTKIKKEEEEDVTYDEEEEILETFMDPPPSPPKPTVLEKYCRSCGKTDAGFFTKLSAPFEDSDADEIGTPDVSQLRLADLYFEITGIHVNQDDNMSQLICYLCEANLKSSYKFRKLALETETLMLQKLNIEHTYDVEALDEAYTDDPLFSVHQKKKRKYVSESDSYPISIMEATTEKVKFMSEFIKPKHRKHSKVSHISNTEQSYVNLSHLVTEESIQTEDAFMEQRENSDECSLSEDDPEQIQNSDNIRPKNDLGNNIVVITDDITDQNDENPSSTTRTSRVSYALMKEFGRSKRKYSLKHEKGSSVR